MTDAKTDSKTWWERTKADEAALHAWLYDQYRGEVGASERIEAFRDAFAVPGTRAHRLLGVIAGQERAHAAWVAELLVARGLSPEVRDESSRYWEAPLAAIEDLETGCAVGAHAERMRLERIEVIARDEGAPPDVRAVFARILGEERFHERAFRSLSTPEALDRTREAHATGRNALGLVP